MSAPSGYTKLPPYVRCRCMNLWVEADGNHWCCKGVLLVGSFAFQADADAERLNVAQALYARFCTDLQHDAGMARSRLIAGIQNAIRDSAPKIASPHAETGAPT